MPDLRNVVMTKDEIENLMTALNQAIEVFGWNAHTDLGDIVLDLFKTLERRKEVK